MLNMRAWFFILCVSGCADSFVPPADAGSADALPGLCPTGELDIQWRTENGPSLWSPVWSLVAVEDEAFYWLRSDLATEWTVHRLGRDGRESHEAYELPEERFSAVLFGGPEPRVARPRTGGSSVSLLSGLPAVDWTLDGERIQLTRWDDDGVFVQRRGTGERATIAVLDATGRTVREPTVVDARFGENLPTLHPPSGAGRPLLSYHDRSDDVLWVGGVDAPLERLPGTRCETRGRSPGRYDVLPMRGDAFAWARVCDREVEVGTSAAGAVHIPTTDPGVSSIALGAGPAGTIVLAMVTYDRFEFVVLDSRTLRSVASGALPVRELASWVSLTRAPVGAAFGIEAGQLLSGEIPYTRMAIARVCP